MRSVLRNLAIIVLLVGVPGISAASSPDLFGFGARSVGTAGTVVSQPHGFEAVYHNPAGLAFEERPGVTLGYTFGQTHLVYSGDELDSDNITSTLIGFDLPLPFGGPLTKRLALGGGFVIPTNTVLKADLPAPGTPDFTIIGNRAHTVTLQAALALRIADSLALGAGFIALSSLDGRIEVGPNAEGRIGSSARDQLVATYAPIIGAITKLPWSLAVGIVYRGESAATFELPLSANLGEGFSIPIPELAIRGVAQYDPRQVETEVSWEKAATRIAIGAKWNQWSRFPQPIIYAAAPSEYPALPPPQFHDTMQYAIGLEHALNPMLTMRSGYRYIPTPVPTSQTLHAHLDSDRHLVSAGAQLDWSKVYLACAGQLHIVERSRLERSEGGSTIHEGHLWILTLELGVTL
jgi:long-subunit fatty acid transport protein